MTTLNNIFKMDSIIDENNLKATKVPIDLIVALLLLIGGVVFGLQSLQEIKQNSSIVYSENPPTENSELAYGDSSGVNLEPFSDKTVKAYRVYYNTNDFKNFRFNSQVGVAIALTSLGFFVYKFLKFEI